MGELSVNTLQGSGKYPSQRYFRWETETMRCEKFLRFVLQQDWGMEFKDEPDHEDFSPLMRAAVEGRYSVVFEKKNMKMLVQLAVIWCYNVHFLRLFT